MIADMKESVRDIWQIELKQLTIDIDISEKSFCWNIIDIDDVDGAGRVENACMLFSCQYSSKLLDNSSGMEDAVNKSTRLQMIRLTCFNH